MKFWGITYETILPYPKSQDNVMTNARHQTFQIRGYCRKNGYQRIANVLQQCAVLYNAALQERRDAYRMQRRSISRIDQMKQFTLVRQDMPEWADLDVTIGRGVLCRVDRAFQGFFKRVSKGQKPGFPRFRSRNRYSCIELSEVRPSMVRASDDAKRAYISTRQHGPVASWRKLTLGSRPKPAPSAANAEPSRYPSIGYSSASSATWYWTETSTPPSTY